MRTIATQTATAATAIAIVIGSPHAFGAGFQINEHGAIGTARGGAVVGTANQPTAVFHNPAGLALTEGTQFMGGVNLIIPRATYTGRGIPAAPLDDVTSQSTDAFVAPVPFAYLSHALSKTAFVGFGFYNNYGLTTKWDDLENFVGRTTVQELSLRTFYMTPTVALKLSDSVRVAVGVSLVPATLSLTRIVGADDNGQVLFPASGGEGEGSVDIRATAFGVGATAGIQIDLLEKLKFGFTYRSAVDLTFEGDADFQLPSDTPASVAANFPDQTINGDLTIPHVFSAGIGWEDTNWTAEIGAQITMWTSFDELRLNFDSRLPTPTTALDRDWKTVPLIRAGGEYRFDKLALRAGLAYDVSPIPDRTADPTLPSNTRINAAIGGGYDFGLLRLDLAYLAVFVMDREITASDENVNFPPASENDTITYSADPIHVISLSLGVAM